ncbi:unnamed protein product [Orchesella dallaii]|uniref:Uncharacterized protein n=1 Tax=Orchesella dallaii TaxID=48710 RepID=A0ABP1RHX3_9HEXA
MKEVTMEMDPVSKLSLEHSFPTQLRKTKDLETSEKTFLKKILTPENKRKGEVEILKEQLKAAESKVRLGKKFQDLTEKVEQLMSDTKRRLQAIQEVDMTKLKKLQKLDKLIEECGKFIQVNFPTSEKAPTFQQYRYEALKKSLESDRKLVAKELDNTKKYTKNLSEVVKDQQRVLSKLQLDNLNEESRRKDAIKELTEKLAIAEEKEKMKIN